MIDVFVCVCVAANEAALSWGFCCLSRTAQGAPADESDRLSARSGRQREAGAGHAQLLRAIQEDLHRRPGAEILKGNKPEQPIHCVEQTGAWPRWPAFVHMGRRGASRWELVALLSSR